MRLFIALCRCRVERKRGTIRHVKYRWEIIADNLSKAGWSLGWVSAIDSDGRSIWIVDAHRDDGRRFVVRADEKRLKPMQIDRTMVSSITAFATNV